MLMFKDPCYIPLHGDSVVVEYSIRLILVYSWSWIVDLGAIVVLVMFFDFCQVKICGYGFIWVGRLVGVGVRTRAFRRSDL
jgi:hypothetical protein